MSKTFSKFATKSGCALPMSTGQNAIILRNVAQWQAEQAERVQRMADRERSRKQAIARESFTAKFNSVIA